MAIEVTLDNFARAETDRMFAGLVQQAGGIDRWFHFREPTPIDNQPVIRMDRDTLYSSRSSTSPAEPCSTRVPTASTA